MARSWARRASGVDVAVECDGITHRVRYRRGSIVVVDHDVAGERSLQALGGDEPACLAVLRAWRHTNFDTVTTPEAVRLRIRSHGRVPAWVVSLPATLDAARRQTLLMTAERTGVAASGGYLLRETQRLALPPLHRWMVAAGEAGRQPIVAKVFVVAAPREPSFGLWREDGSLVVGVSLRPSWWRDVALHGSPLVDGDRVFLLDRGRGLRWREGRVVEVDAQAN